MKLYIIFCLVFSLLVKEAMAFEYKPRWTELPCQICIERPEEQGILNIREVRVVIDDKESIILVGGQAACFYVLHGDHFVYAVSFDPYDPNSKDPKAWSSNRINFTLETGKRAAFEVKKSDEENGKGWFVEKISIE